MIWNFRLARLPLAGLSGLGLSQQKRIKERCYGFQRVSGKKSIVSEPLEAILVIALGKPVEKVVIEEVPESGSIKYYRTEDGVHHVPKRSLQDILMQVYD